MPSKIVSGGQTGVDRAALDVALQLDIPHGGWCPRGRLAEDGPIADCYQLRETRSPNYAQRTERNVLDSDGTLILYRGTVRGGTLRTHQLAARHKQPYLTVDMTTPIELSEVHQWMRSAKIEVLNVAGPRESQSPGIGQLAREYLLELLDP